APAPDRRGRGRERGARGVAYAGRPGGGSQPTRHRVVLFDVASCYPRSSDLPLDFRFLIARRYLAASRRVSLVSVISALSVAGVALGVTALIVVLSVMNGFYDLVRDLLVSFDPHVRIEAVEGRGLTNADSVMSVAEALAHVESAAAYVEGKALLSYRGAADETQ